MINMIKVLENCVGCGTCVFACKERAIIVYGRAEIIKEKCINCMRCIKFCPINAIRGN